MPPKGLRGGRGPQEGPPTQLHNFHHQQQQQQQPMPQGQYPMNSNNNNNNSNANANTNPNNNNTNNNNTSIPNNMNANNNNSNNNSSNNNNNNYYNSNMGNNNNNMNKNNNNSNNNRNLGNNNNNNNNNMYADPNGNNNNNSAMGNPNQGRYSQNMNNSSNNNNNWGGNQGMNNSSGGGQGYNDYNNNNMGGGGGAGGNMGGGGGYGGMMNNNNSNMGGPPQGGGYDMGYNEGGGYAPHPQQQQQQQQPMPPRMQPHKSPYPQQPPPQQQQQPPMQSGGGGMMGQQPPPHGNNNNNNNNPNRMRGQQQQQQQQQQPPSMPPQQQQQQQPAHQQRNMNPGVMPPMHQHQHQHQQQHPVPPPQQQPPYGGGGGPMMQQQPPMGQGNMGGGGYGMDPYGMDPMQQQPPQQSPMRDSSYGGGGNSQMDMSLSPPPQQGGGGGGNLHGYGPGPGVGGGGYGNNNNNMQGPPPHQQMNAPMQQQQQPMPMQPPQQQHGGASNRRGGGGNLHMGAGGMYNSNSNPNSNNNSSIGGGRVGPGGAGGGAPHNMPSPGPNMGPGTNSNLSSRQEPWQSPNPNMGPMPGMGGGYGSVPPQPMMPPPHGGVQTHSPAPQSAGGYMSGPPSSMPPPMVPPQQQQPLPPPPPQQQQQQPMYYAPPQDQMGGMMPMDEMMALDNEQGYGLQNFLEEFDLIETCQLQDLFPPSFVQKRDVRCVMAIDGDHMLNKLKEDLREIEPLSLLHSALPDHLLELVTEHVKGLRARNVEPAWVFNGVGIVGDVEAFLPSEEELLARDTVWEQLNEGRLPPQDAITEAFQTCSSIGPDVAMAVQRFLRSELGVFCVTAPALNWCQMAAFHKEEVVHLLMGHPEMLIVPYDNMTLILDMDLASGRVTYANRDRVLRTMFPSYCTPTSTAAAGERLLDLGLLTSSYTAIHTARAGLRVSAQIIYQELSSPTPAFSRVIDFIAYHIRTDNREEAEVLKHPKGRSYVRYSPVFTYNASFESPMVYFQRVLNPKLTNQNMPNNLSKIFGHLVPLSFFYFQFVGLLSVSFMTVVTQAYFYDGCPVSDTHNYHDYMPTLVALRSQIAYQLFAKMSDEVNRLLARLSWVRWYREILMPLQRQTDVITLDEWQLQGVDEIEKVDDHNLEDVTIATVLSINSTSNCFTPEQTAQGSEMKIYHGRKQTFFAVLLKFFDFLGYFSHNPPPEEEGQEDGPDGQPVPRLSGGGASAGALVSQPSIDHTMSGDHEVYNFTSCLSTSLKSCPHDFQDALIRLMELSRIGIMNCEPWHCITASRTPEPECADSPELLLASRIACLISIPYSLPAKDREQFTWAPVYSRHLCAFSVAVRAMNSALRGLAEVLTTTVYLSNYSDCHISEFAGLTPLLPFGDIPSTIGGLLLHYVLVFPRDYESNCVTRKDRCNFLQDKFRAIPDLQVQLQRVMEFTFQALFLLNSLRVLNARLEEMGEEDLNGGMKSMSLSEEVLYKTLDIMCEKWQDHLEAPLPVDEHKLWPPSQLSQVPSRAR